MDLGGEISRHVPPHDDSDFFIPVLAARYGDAFNPWGDLMTVARAWCVTKPGGVFIIGIPFEQDLGETIAYAKSSPVLQKKN